VGSIIVGSAEFIHKAHRMRKLLGGAMRQVAHAACWRTALHVYDICTNKHTNTQTASRLTSCLVNDPEHCARFQVAVLAAPGLVALRDTPPLLVEDHANAQLIAHGGG
jgi:threonine aldolase